MTHHITPSYTLPQLILYFLKLGTTGFGGPVALVGYMHKDLVENRRWISEEDYKQGLTLSQLAPGALAGAVCVIAIQSIVDLSTACIAIATVLVLLCTKKIQEPYIILVAAAAGVTLKLL